MAIMSIKYLKTKKLFNYVRNTQTAYPLPNHFSIKTIDI